MQSLTWLNISYFASLTFYNIIFTQKLNLIWAYSYIYSELIGLLHTNLCWFFLSGFIWPVCQCAVQTTSESMGSTWSRMFWNYNCKNVTIGKFLFLSSSRDVHDKTLRYIIFMNLFGTIYFHMLSKTNFYAPRNLKMSTCTICICFFNHETTIKSSRYIT